MIRVAALVVALLVGGCASPANQWTQHGGDVAPTDAIDSPQADTSMAGWVNGVIQQLKGVEVNSALPWGFIPLMAWIIYLSHRRAVLRIKADNTRRYTVINNREARR